MKLILYGRYDDILIGGVTQFKYPGRMMEETESEYPTVHRSISKAHAVWCRLVNLLLREGDDIWVSALLYRTVIQAVMMFGSEYWELSDATMRSMEGYHVGF